MNYLALIKDISIIIGGIATLFMLINGLMEFIRQGKQRRVDHFVMLRRRLKENPVFGEICLFLHDNDAGLKNVSAQNKRDFMGLIEEVAIMLNSKLIPPDVAFYMFGFYAAKCLESKHFWENMGITPKDKNWILFYEFANKAKLNDAKSKKRKLMF